MFVEVIRLLVTLTLTAVGFRVGGALSLGDTAAAGATGAVIGAGVGYVAGGVVGRGIRSRLERTPVLVERTSGPELFAGAFGVLVGMAVGVTLSVPLIVFLPGTAAWPLSALVVLVLAVFGARLFASRASDLLAIAGLQARPVTRPGGTVLDSSAAIDGRVLHLAGMLSEPVRVPSFVIDELQALADAADRTRRRRGRRGLDVIAALGERMTLEVVEDTVPEMQDVDAKLLTLSERWGSGLLTTDHNLAKAAELRGVVVLNPQALSEALKPAAFTGDRISITVAREGSEPGQGVGYLDDGTMVVIDGAAGRVGEDLEAEVVGTTRTAVGRMLFARVVS